METKHERPIWIREFKKPVGTEIKYINGHWYLYERSSIWDPSKRKPKKKSGKLIGTITETGLALRHEKAHIEELSCYEFAASFFLYKVSSQIREDLILRFQKIGLLIYCLAILIVKENSSLKLSREYYNESYLKILIGKLSFSPENIKISLFTMSEDANFLENLNQPTFNDFISNSVLDFNMGKDLAYGRLSKKELFILYYFAEKIRQEAYNFIKTKNIEEDAEDVISLLKTFHILRNNRKYVKTKPIREVEKLCKELEVNFET